MWECAVLATTEALQTVDVNWYDYCIVEELTVWVYLTVARRLRGHCLWDRSKLILQAIAQEHSNRDKIKITLINSLDQLFVMCVGS